MAEIKVSVIVATYNHEKYIRHTLESIIAQKVSFTYEVLVGEDCSTDGTASIVKEYAEKYPKLIIPVIRDKNLGGTANLMDLLARSRGEYVAFIEGDDYWIDENKLQEQVIFLDSHPDYTACFALCIIVDENENRLTDLEQYSGFMKTGGEYTVHEFEDYILPGQTATSMYRKIAYAQLQQKMTEAHFNTQGFIDRHLVLIMLSIGRMHVLNKNVSAYRYVMNDGSGSWSSKNDYYSVDNLINYLVGLKEMEKLGKLLGLEVNFDGRRVYEWNKLVENKENFSKEDVDRIRYMLKNDCNNPDVLPIGFIRKLIDKITLR